MRYLLDANTVIALISRNQRVTRRVSASVFGLSIIVAHELYFGAYRSRHVTRNMAAIDDLPLAIVAFDDDDALLAGAIRAELAAGGKPTGMYDLFIAAQARSRDLTVITHNVAEFSRVPGLRWEGWEA